MMPFLCAFSLNTIKVEEFLFFHDYYLNNWACCFSFCICNDFLRQGPFENVKIYEPCTMIDVMSRPYSLSMPKFQQRFHMTRGCHHYTHKLISFHSSKLSFKYSNWAYDNKKLLTIYFSMHAKN